MDQDLAWWASVVFDGWRDRSGPRYQRLASCLLDCVTSGTLTAGTRVPAERVLAPVVGVSRGTVVACFDQLVSVGVLRRQVGAGTFVVGRPSWAATGSSNGRLAGPLLRQSTSGVDLSLSYPADLRHLPPVSLDAGWAALDGDGLELAGVPVLRSAVAEYLTSFQQLPTSAEQIVVTAGAQEALWLLGRVLRPGRVLASCPTYPGLASAFGSGRVAAASDTRMFARAPAGSVGYVMPTGHNPVGSVLPSLWRQSMAAVADAGRVTVIEDLALADLCLSAPLALTPVAALSPEVLAVGSVSKLFWGGLRIGWIRIPPEALRSSVIAAKLPTSALSQVTAASLLSSVTADWLSGLRAVLRERRDHLCALIGTQLPAWRVPELPEAGLSLWVSLPVVDASAFAAVASRHGVRVLPGAAACVCGRHRGFIRLSFASQLDTLSLAVERLAAAWEVHAENLAALLLCLLVTVPLTGEAPSACRGTCGPAR
jgi:DNA-binding transcriptional MocR family regulator